MPDLQNLNLSQEPVEVDYDNYVEPSEFPPPIPEGVYTFKQGKPSFTRSQDENGKTITTALFDHTVEGGEQNGKQIRFDRASSKTFLRGGVRVAMAVDQLYAVGDTSRPRTVDDLERALLASEGRPFKAQVGWEAYCKACDKSVKGERNFPASPNGTGHLNEVSCPGCQQTIRANSRITRRIPA